MVREWLKELRINKGLTQEDLASVLGMSQAMYSKIETGERQKKMDLIIAFKIAKVFRISLKRIWEYEEAVSKEGAGS